MCIDISGRFTIHTPVLPPSGVQFCPVVRWTDATGAVRRLKLFAGVGEILPLATYIGEAIIAPACIEIYNTQDYNPCELAADWSLPIGLLEDPTNPADRTGTIYVVDTCIPTFAYSNPYAMLYECPCCTEIPLT